MLHMHVQLQELENGCEWSRDNVRSIVEKYSTCCEVGASMHACILLDGVCHAHCQLEIDIGQEIPHFIAAFLQLLYYLHKLCICYSIALMKTSTV